MTWPVSQLVSQSDSVALQLRLVADGYVIRTFDSVGVTDAAGLWQRAGDALGFEDVGGWDSFADHLWNAVLPDDDEGDKVALVWEHADALLPDALDVFLEAYDVLVTMARSAYEDETDVTVCFLGDGPAFRAVADLG